MSDVGPTNSNAGAERPFVVGLTGGIASGKTTVSDAFSDLGIEVVDADVVAREVVAPGQPALKELRTLFGEDIIDSDGALDRRRMRTKMFADATLRRKAEAILHPRIRESMWRQVAAARSAYCVLVVPLLIETGGHRMVDRVLVVDVDEATQRARLMKRDGSNLEEVQAILAAQTTRRERLLLADDVIDNSGDLDSVFEQVRELHANYVRIALLDRPA